jgi:hypothetical protein
MAQSDYNIANDSAPAVRAKLNTVFESIATNNAGSAEPTTTFAHQWWYDATTNILKQRNAADDAWIDIGQFDQSAGTFQPIGTPQLTQVQVEDDTDTTFGLVSGQRLGQGAVAATTGFRPPDAHFAGVYSSGTGTLPLGSSLRNVITGSAAVVADTLTLQAGSYYVEAFASLRLIDGLGSVQGASVALLDVTGSAELGIVNSMRTNQRSSGGRASMPFYLTVAAATDYRLDFQRSNSDFVASQAGGQSTHSSGTTRYDHELRIWQIG